VFLSKGVFQSHLRVIGQEEMVWTRIHFTRGADGLNRNGWRQKQAPEKALFRIFSVQTLIWGIGYC
jgi:hypothetical protein